MASFTYAGIGSRETPQDVLTLMTSIAQELGTHGWKLRTGGAHGADSAFATGAASIVMPNREIHLPWSGYNGCYHGYNDHIVPPELDETYRIAALHHPAWARLTQGVRKLMARNVTIVLGPQLDDPADMIICWTPGGRLQGGTAQAMKVGASYGIPIFNLATDGDLEHLVQFVRSK